MCEPESSVCTEPYGPSQHRNTKAFPPECIRKCVILTLSRPDTVKQFPGPSLIHIHTRKSTIRVITIPPWRLSLTYKSSLMVSTTCYPYQRGPNSTVAILITLITSNWDIGHTSDTGTLPNKEIGPCKMFLKFTVFKGVRARVRDAISPILRYSTLFAAILGPECLVDFLFKVFLIFGSVPVDPNRNTQRRHNWSHVPCLLWLMGSVQMWCLCHRLLRGEECVHVSLSVCMQNGQWIHRLSPFTTFF